MDKRREGDIAIISHRGFLYHTLNKYVKECHPIVAEELGKQLKSIRNFDLSAFTASFADASNLLPRPNQGTTNIAAAEIAEVLDALLLSSSLVVISLEDNYDEFPNWREDGASTRWLAAGVGRHPPAFEPRLRCAVLMVFSSIKKKPTKLWSSYNLCGSSTTRPTYRLDDSNKRHH